MQLKLALVIVYCILCELKYGETREYMKIRQTKFENEILDKVPPIRVSPISKMTAFQRAISYQEPVLPNEENCIAIIDEMFNFKRSVQCKPRETIVELISEFRIEPSVVLVRRCGGGCNGHYKCLPSLIEEKVFYIKLYKKNAPICSSVRVLEHKSCKCQCKNKAEDCAANQIYDKNTCRCKCRNEDRDYCISRKHKFNEFNCSCLCSIKNCTTGTVWQPKTCRCIKLA